MSNSYIRSAVASLLLAVTCMALSTPIARGQDIEDFPLTASDFQMSAPRGFGDRDNSWAQAMIWWHNNLYVGTSRDSLCASLYGVYLEGVAVLGTQLANQYLPYPPNDPDLSCTPDPADLPLAAQIWRWSPDTDSWQQVYESPDTLPNPGTGPPAPPRTGKFLPYEVSFRGFAAYTESDGTEALYAFGVNSTLLWYRGALPPPRILRTTDGVNWTPVPQDPGTFLGDLPFNPDHSTYRSPVSYNGMLFTLCGQIQGQGALIASANPSQGDDAWFLASPPGMEFYELAVFNGWLYLGGFDQTKGYEVFKTQAQGSPPYALTLVVPRDAGLTNDALPSKSVVSMFVHNDRLYVGTATFPEIIRINTDDTWDLIMGRPRIDPVSQQWKYPTSNLDAGFGLTLNDHIWYQANFNNDLYAGTYNASTGQHTDPVFGPILQPTMGGQVYQTANDWYWTAVTTNGFSNPSDPYGGMFDYGIRTMLETPYGLFLGTANDYFGLAIFQGSSPSIPEVQPPQRLDIEPTRSGGALLSWLAGFNATSYQIWRAEMLPILVRDNLNVEGWNGVLGNKIPDVYVGPYQFIGTTADLTFLDSTVQAGSRYMYYVLGVSATGVTSTQSNLATLPLLLPSITFAQLESEVGTLAQRQRFAEPDTQGTNERQVIEAAKTTAAACQIDAAISLLSPETGSTAVLFPDQIDYQILINKMIRRLQLYKQYPAEVITSELCTQPPLFRLVTALTSPLTTDSSGNYVAGLVVQNEGNILALGAQLTGAVIVALNTSGTLQTTPTTSPLPSSLGDILPGGAATVSVSFLGSAGGSGKPAVIRFSLSSSGGNAGGSIRTTLP